MTTATLSSLPVTRAGANDVRGSELRSIAGFGPRVRTLTKDRNSFWGVYKNHEIHLTREDQNDDWYIQVIADDGGRLYDGTWRDSTGKSRRAAILEALRGAMLWPNIASETRGHNAPSA